MSRRPVVLLAWGLWVLAMAGVATIPWVDHLLRQAGRPELTQLDASTIPAVIAAVVAATVGAVLASRRPHHPVGWLLLALGLSVTASGVADGYARYGLMARPGALPAARWLAVYSPATPYAGFILVGFILLLTPSGSLPSPRWRWWAWLMAAGPVILLVALTVGPGLVIPPYESAIDPVAVPALAGAVGIVIAVAIAIAAGGLVVGAWSLVVRFRHAHGTERQQLRWVAFAAAVTVLPTAVVGVGVPAVLAAGVCMVLLPLAVGAAILRYRLYDLDYLISRTVVYGLLTAAGVGVYIAVVKLAEWLLTEGAGMGGSLLATAVIAVGFAPARIRLQRLVDRRLYGERHDPVQAMVRLGARLRDAPGGAPGGNALVGVLQGVCEALRLPWASLRIEDGVEVASFGRPATGSESIPLEHEGQRIGALLVGMRSGEDALGVADRQVLGILAAPVAVALHAVLLSQELQRSRERLVAAREEERRRLRRDLHDGLGPILTAVTLKADAARSVLSTAPDRADGLLAELRGNTNQAIGDLRRVVYDLRPASLDELGLLGALSQQVDWFAHQGLTITMHAPIALPALPAAVEVAAYRILTEALTNIARHADAHRVTVTLAIDGELGLEVQDDGAASTANGHRWYPGVGLTSMAERVAEVGGTLQAGPTPTGGRVQASLPLELA